MSSVFIQVGRSIKKNQAYSECMLINESCGGLLLYGAQRPDFRVKAQKRPLGISLQLPWLQSPHTEVDLWLVGFL